MILMIDNFDSFTYNLVQYMGEQGAHLRVCRNNSLTIGEIRRMRPEKIVISPGPGTPDNSGISLEIIRTFSGEIPILGVCLGHQCIGQAFGGKIIRAPRLLHGKTSEIHHDGAAIFRELPNPFTATRYHSLIVERETLPEGLEISAWTGDNDNLIMGLRHREHPTEGVQFHPESILTREGKQLIGNFLRM